MLKNIFFPILILSTFLIGCKKDKPIVEASVSEDTILPTSITINGDDKQALRYFNLIDYSHLFGEDTSVDERQRQDIVDSLFYDIDSITKPKIMEIMAFGNNQYHTRIFVTPGDSVSIELTNGRFKFSGKNAEQYAFYYEMDSTDFQYVGVSYDGNIYDYKKKCKAIYESNTAFYNDYIKKHPTVSEVFKKNVSAELKFEYLYNLINPRINYNDSNVYINSMEGLANVIASDSRTPEGNFLNFKDYFDGINIEDFNRPELVNNDYFKRSLVDFIRQYFKKSDYMDYTLESFNAEKKFIDENLNGEINKYAEGRLISDYYKKGFGSDDITKDVLKKAIVDYKKQHLKTSYRDNISKIEGDLEVVDSKLKVDEFGEKLLTLKGATIDLKSVFEKEKGTIKVIDIWASWCPPCVKDIKEASVFKSQMALQKNVKWIHLSIDNDSKKWLKASKQLHQFLPFEHQYLMVDYTASNFLKELKVLVNGKIQVPSYIIINSDNMVILNNAPKPSDSLAFKAVLDKIK